MRTGKQVVYLLEHSYEREPCGCDEAKLIGVYSSREKAEAEIERLKSMPGFVDHPDGFNIDAHEVDGEGSWQEGFKSILPGDD